MLYRYTSEAMASSTKRRPSGLVVTIRSTPSVLNELDHLARIGLFGKSRAEVAEELMRTQLRQLHREGWFGTPKARDAAKPQRGGPK